ncbi:DUF3054 domain-containing protein [Leucobacter allii]|uniref:DUF3054 domain-containing protein n=1 Tax=Leucobacter allii TaxID=2932247 RepID=A0ABY4FPR8_9MICO|nr:DUF3054 domain-containing protein [Leucobacter allii]UOQ58194.1 DUF3054 domain-containing protein [Leucobacter allii]
MSGATTAVAQAGRRAAGTGSIVGALVLDATLVVLFAWLGRSEHAREATLGGLFGTAWPFLAALTVVWIAAAVFRRPLAPLRSGLPVWLGTVALGLALRGLGGGGLALPFVVVTAVALGAFLVGWRLIAALLRRLPARAERTR